MRESCVEATICCVTDHISGEMLRADETYDQGLDEHASLDDIDRRIVSALVADARRSFADIGALVRLSAPAVKRRVDRLRAAGVITGFTAVVDPARLGWTTEAYVELYCDGRTSPDQIQQAVRRHPEVTSACTVSGSADAIVQLRARDITHLEQGLERLRAEPFVTRTKSVVVLSRLV